MPREARLTNPFKLIGSHLTSSWKLETVSQSDEGDIAQPNKDDDTDEEDVPGWEVYLQLNSTPRLTVTVQRQVESGNEEVENRQGPRTSDSVVRKDVSHDRELGVKRNRRPGE